MDRKFPEEFPRETHLWGTEGSRAGQREKLKCDADPSATSVVSSRLGVGLQSRPKLR